MHRGCLLKYSQAHSHAYTDGLDDVECEHHHKVHDYEYIQSNNYNYDDDNNHIQCNYDDNNNYIQPNNYNHDNNHIQYIDDHHQLNKSQDARSASRSRRRKLAGVTSASTETPEYRWRWGRCTASTWTVDEF